VSSGLWKMGCFAVILAIRTNFFPPFDHMKFIKLENPYIFLYMSTEFSSHPVSLEVQKEQSSMNSQP
jgi:hypothetical protein